LEQLKELFINLIIKSDVKKVNANNYASSLITNSFKILERNSNTITEQQYQQVKEFILLCYKNFCDKSPKEDIHLTLSHGDIKQENIIQKKNKLLLIDWEFCNYRLPNYDILKSMLRFSCLDEIFYKSLVKRIISSSNIKGRSELQIYFHEYKDIYLYLFYLEDINLRLFQFENRGFARDFSKINKHIEKLIVNKAINNKNLYQRV
jgi:hypothetical protein